jgi:hypothetical protein
LITIEAVTAGDITAAGVGIMDTAAMVTVDKRAKNTHSI